MITMYDSIDIGTIPLSAVAVAGYVNGRWPTYPALLRAFPAAHVLSVAVSADADAEALDVEPGDASAGQVAGWVHRQMARKVYRPVIYCSVQLVSTVVGKLAAAGIDRSQVRLWSAHWTTEHVCGPTTCAYTAGGQVVGRVDGTQWTNRALGRNLDQSLLLSRFFAAAPPGPAISHEEGNCMHESLRTGAAPVICPRWAATAAQDLPPMFSQESIVLTGDSGVSVSVEFLADGYQVGVQVYQLARGEPMPVTAPPGTRVLRFWRTDTAAALAASVDVFRK